MVKPELTLRPLVSTDCNQLLVWRNTPFIVDRSLSRRPVGPEEHRRWFDALLQRKDVLAWIIEDRGHPVGHVRAEERVDEVANHWLLTIYLMKQATGRGLGVRAIVQACLACAQKRPGLPVVAEVLTTNNSALHAFARSGFQRDPSRDSGSTWAMTWRNSDEEAKTVRHYEGLYARHGDSHSALDWGSQAGQQLRFQVLAGIGDLAGASVLDVGCGLAHFADWLQQRAPSVRYTGLDIVPALLAAARKRRPDLRLVAGSIQDDGVLAGESFDYVFASGIFYTYAAGADRVLQSSVRRMWSLARRGVAFNALGTHAPDQIAGEYYADPQAVLRFCRELSPRAELIIGYHPRDFTIYLHRDPA